MTALYALALAALLAAAPGLDTVLLQNGGRLVGTVVEENPTAGVTIQLPGGQQRTVPPAEIFRIEYRDGTLGVLGAKPKAGGAPEQAAPPPAAPAADAAAPPAGAAPAAAAAPATAATAATAQPGPPPGTPAPSGPPPGAPPPNGPPMVAPGQAVYPAVPVGPPGPPPMPPGAAVRSPRGPRMFMLAFGLGVAGPDGNAEGGLPMGEFMGPQLLLEMEGGLRFTPHLMATLVLDLGVGSPGDQVQADCDFYGATDCTAVSVRFGTQLRYSFRPFGHVNPWISVGTAFEMGSVSDAKDDHLTNYDLTYRGWEMLRLGGGVDFRINRTVGWGPFLMVSVGRYSSVEYQGASFDTEGSRTHTWIQAGARFVLFP